MAQIGQRPFLSTHLANRLSLQIRHFTFSSLIGILPLQNLLDCFLPALFAEMHLFPSEGQVQSSLSTAITTLLFSHPFLQK